MDYSRDILALNDAELERFVLRWLQVMSNPKYHSTQRFAGAGDMGRDVVGFLTKARHQGPWHNYQCKQLGRNLGVHRPSRAGEDPPLQSPKKFYSP